MRRQQGDTATLAAREAAATPAREAAHQQLRAVAEDPDSRLHRLAMTLTRNAAAARELTRRTLDCGLRALDQFQPDTNLRVWLLRTQVNLFLDDCRRRAHRSRSRPIDDITLAEAPAWSTITPAQLQAALSGMCPVLREIYQLRVRDGLSYQGIAERLQIPMGAVSTQLARAREFLQNALRSTTAAPPEVRR